MFPDGQVGIASARGLFRLEDLVPPPAIRWNASIACDPDVPWRIVHILPRRNHLLRPPIANLDGLIITVSAAEPQPDFYLADKLLTVCLINQIEPLLCLTKIDLATDTDLLAGYQPTGCSMIETSPEDESGLVELKNWMTGRFVSFAGQSGVGKSTLLNRLFGQELMPEGHVSSRIGRGRHTTRHVELFPLNDGFVADTPGFSSLELADFDISGEQLVTGYPEIQAVADRCRFTDCRHIGEPGCAVSTGDIHPDRLLRYRFFRNQLDSIDPHNR